MGKRVKRRSPQQQSRVCSEKIRHPARRAASKLDRRHEDGAMAWLLRERDRLTPVHTCVRIDPAA